MFNDEAATLDVSLCAGQTWTRGVRDVNEPGRVLTGGWTVFSSVTFCFCCFAPSATLHGKTKSWLQLVLNTEDTLTRRSFFGSLVIKL